jgi:hypothetical protein
MIPGSIQPITYSFQLLYQIPPFHHALLFKSYCVIYVISSGRPLHRHLVNLDSAAVSRRSAAPAEEQRLAYPAGTATAASSAVGACGGSAAAAAAFAAGNYVNV